MSFRFEFLDRLKGTFHASAKHCLRVKRDVRAAPSVDGWREIISVSLPGHLVDRDCHRLGHIRLFQKPLCMCPRLHDSLGMRISSLHQIVNVVERIEHQQGLFQRLGGNMANDSIAQ